MLEAEGSLRVALRGYYVLHYALGSFLINGTALEEPCAAVAGTANGSVARRRDAPPRHFGVRC